MTAQVSCLTGGIVPRRAKSAWRSWPLPVIDAEPAAADGILARVDAWAATLRERQSQVEELRRLVMRSVLPGAVTLTENRSDDVKGE